MTTSFSSRLQSLDLLRGLDMLLLTVFGPLLWTIDRVWGVPPWICEQLVHARWAGFTLWDLIMPLFIFMSGAAIPFAVPKRLTDGRAGWPFWRHVLGRVAFLWITGMVVQGNLLSLDPSRFFYYSNTLQAIAAGYLIAAPAFLMPRRWMRVTLPLVLAGGYTFLLATLGDATFEENFALRVERWLFPSYKEGYAFTLTSMMFGAVSLCGMNCAEWLRGEASPWRKVGVLALVGGVLLGGGFLLELWEPPIKRVFNLTFTVQAMGWSVLALSMLYMLADVLHLCRGPGIVTLFGQHALTAYLCVEAFAPLLHHAARILTQGFPHWFGNGPQPFIQSLASAALIVFVLYLRRRVKC